MQVVLNHDVKTLGRKGDVVTVKPGYFRNFLFPRGIADVATTSRLKLAEERKKKMVMEKEQIMANAKDVISKIDGLKIELSEKANEKGHLYAAISEIDVLNAIEETSKVKLDLDFIDMSLIKEVGEHTVKVNLGEDMEAEVKVLVNAL